MEVGPSDLVLMSVPISEPDVDLRLDKLPGLAADEENMQTASGVVSGLDLVANIIHPHDGSHHQDEDSEKWLAEQQTNIPGDEAHDRSTGLYQLPWNAGVGNAMLGLQNGPVATPSTPRPDSPDTLPELPPILMWPEHCTDELLPVVFMAYVVYRRVWKLALWQDNVCT